MALVVAAGAMIVIGGGLWYMASRPYKNVTKYTIPPQLINQADGRYRQTMYESVADNLDHPDFKYHLHQSPTWQDLGTYGMPRTQMKLNPSSALMELYRTDNLFL